MPVKKFDELMKLRRTETNKKSFILPGLISANKTLEKCFENLQTPFGNHGNFVKVVF
jgi:hypothetical protein